MHWTRTLSSLMLPLQAQASTCRVAVHLHLLHVLGDNTADTEPLA